MSDSCQINKEQIMHQYKKPFDERVRNNGYQKKRRWRIKRIEELERSEEANIDLIKQQNTRLVWCIKQIEALEKGIKNLEEGVEILRSQRDEAWQESKDQFNEISKLRMRLIDLGEDLE